MAWVIYNTLEIILSTLPQADNDLNTYLTCDHNSWYRGRNLNLPRWGFSGSFSELEQIASLDADMLLALFMSF